MFESYILRHAFKHKLAIAKFCPIFHALNMRALDMLRRFSSLAGFYFDDGSHTLLARQSGDRTAHHATADDADFAGVILAEFGAERTRRLLGEIGLEKQGNQISGR